jgi:hypothetical protein
MIAMWKREPVKVILLIAISFGLLCAVSISLDWYIPAFDRLTPKYGDELTEAVNAYLQILDRRIVENSSPEELCSQRTVDKEFELCVSSLNSPGMHDSRYVERLRVITYTPECSIVIANIHTMGSFASAVFRLIWEDDVWKIADRWSGYREDIFGRRGLITMANPPLPFSCSKE